MLEFAFAQLEQADIGAGAVLGIEIGFDLGDRFEEILVESEQIGRALDFFDRRAERNVAQR